MKCRYCKEEAIGMVGTNDPGGYSLSFSFVCEVHKDKGVGLDE